ncbi:hypothetical protein [Nocardia wallacei]|nr:hypothetical protein [Nocardia wallacei]
MKREAYLYGCDGSVWRLEIDDEDPGTRLGTDPDGLYHGRPVD